MRHFRKKMALISTGIALGLLAVGPVLAHEKHDHSAMPGGEKPDEARKARLTRINERYVRDIQPIFEQSCLDCHSSKTRYPWYYELPIVRNWIDEDIAEAKKHLDMTQGFPFQGHGSPEEDLKAIGDVVQQETMPPFRYWILHWGARLNTQEKKKILDWVSESKKLLEESE